MKVRLPKRPCSKCFKSMLGVTQEPDVIMGNPQADVLFIWNSRTHAPLSEAFVDILARFGFALDQCAGMHAVRCKSVKTGKKHYLNCGERIHKAILRNGYKLVLCFGKEALMHLFHRSATVPSLELLAVNPVEVAEYPGMKILTFPSPDAFDTPAWAEEALSRKEQEYLVNVKKLIVRGLQKAAEIRKEYRNG